MEFYSSTKKNEILSFKGKWVELENTILSEVSHIEKDKGYVFFSHVGVRYKYKHKQNHIFM
jgi:hypothetical protein